MKRGFGLRASGFAVVFVLSMAATSLVAGQTLNLTQVGSIPGPVDFIKAQGSFVYLTEAKTFTIFDVSEPAAPKRVGVYTFPEKIWGFRIVGTRAFVADGHSGLGILDISKPSAPALLSLTKLPGQAKNVSVTGNRALLANHMSGVDVVDISDQSKPAIVGSAYLDGYARDVATFGSMAVAVDHPAGLYVFDMAGGNPLEPITSIQSAKAPQQIEVVEIPSGAGNARIAVLAGSVPYDPLSAKKPPPGGFQRGGSIQLYDVSNPTAPVFVSMHPVASSHRRIAVKGSLVYVADGEEGLQILDISTPSKMSVAGQFKTSKPARDVAVGDSVIAVVAGEIYSGSRSHTEGDVLLLRQTR
jgi:hypothetical protein